MDALAVLHPHFKEADLDREVMNALWGMCFFARAWGVHPNGMLRRNNLISVADVDKLERWINAIGYAVAMLLGGGDAESAFVYRASGSFP